jgi:hypothetical protein
VLREKLLASGDAGHCSPWAAHDASKDHVQILVLFEFGICFTGERNFLDAEGNLVRIISAGRGDELLFTNLDAEDKTVSLTGNGSVLKTIINPTDGTSTNQATGHNVIILFPTDITEGPSTTLYEGRVVFTATAANEFEIVTSSGPTRDICSELA